MEGSGDFPHDGSGFSTRLMVRGEAGMQNQPAPHAAGGDERVLCDLLADGGVLARGSVISRLSHSAPSASGVESRGLPLTPDGAAAALARSHPFFGEMMSNFTQHVQQAAVRLTGASPDGR
ncbi:MAG: hypothetical protein H6816_11480 [Phycisphaerales bacterium]|nr:hypothetical protein [Phycisphaerales bacterium]